MRCEAERIAKMISGLPENYRVPVVLRYQEDVSITEIALTMGIAPGAVRVRLHRALAMLSERLAVVSDEL
jgi:RNA polymerase sigma-70 factor, ECF subfamily